MCSLLIAPLVVDGWRRARATVCAAALFVLASTNVAAQPAVRPARADGLPVQPAPAESWVHESWTVKDGLPVNSINWLLQDRAGYIWAATFDGLVRFDGVRFTVFNSANSDGLPSNRILQLLEARDGALWLGTEQRQLVRFREGRFVTFTPRSAGRDEQISSFVEDTSGAMWVGTTGGLWIVRGARFDRVAPEALSANVTALERRNDGSIWAGTHRAGLFRVTSGTGGTRVERIAVDPALDTSAVSRMYEDPDGVLWIAGKVGLWSGRERFTRVQLPTTLSFGPQYFLHSPTYGALWISAHPNGLIRVESGLAEFVDLRSRYILDGTRLSTDGPAVWRTLGGDVFRNGELGFALRSTLPGTVGAELSIATTLLDREGSLWFGTQTAGLHRLKPSLFATYSTAEGLGARNVYPTYVDRSGTVWAGTGGEGVSRIDSGSARADALAQDRSHLSRRLRQLLGETPTELIRRLRLEEGERLLTHGTGTVADVAYSVGFNSVSYFCR